MGVGCGEQGEEQKCILGFMGKPEERHHLQETVTQGITLRWCFKKQNGTEGLHTSGCGEVQAVASTEHSKDKFNIVHFLCNCSIATVLNTKLLHNVYLFLSHISASILGHLNGVCCSFVCSLYVNIFGISLYT